MEKVNNTKQQILDASLKLFSENGYHGASIRDIAKAVDKRESAIYNHFSSKEEIYKQIIDDFGSRNFGSIIITDKLINIISKPEKFFLMLSENLIDFWNTEKERMFIKILMSNVNLSSEVPNYTLNSYLSDFKKLFEFIFKEMSKHKFISKIDIKTLSSEFISPLFLLETEIILGKIDKKQIKSELKNHVEFFWMAARK